MDDGSWFHASGPAYIGATTMKTEGDRSPSTFHLGGPTVHCPPTLGMHIRTLDRQ